MRESSKTTADLEQEIQDITAEYTDFVYAVSHDLSSSFRAVEGFSQITRKRLGDSLDENTNKNLDLMEQAVGTGRGILDSLLEFSRLNTQPEPKAQIDSADLIKEALLFLKDLSDDKKAVINIGELPVIYAMRNKTTFLFFHLLQNALLYHKDNQIPHIDISARDHNDFWEFCIKDNGIGIRDRMQEKVFKPLQRVVSDKYPGTGMGLTIVKKVAHQHGGDVWFESDLESGSSFFVTIKKS